MKASNKPALTEGPLQKNIILFSIPLMMSNLLQVLFNMADIAVVGTFSGPAALGSVGSTVTLVALFTSVLMGVATAANILTALYIGAKDRLMIKKTVHTSLILCLAFGLIILLAGELFGRIILETLNTKQSLIDGAVLYLRIYFLGMPALAIYNFGNAVLSAAGDTKRPLKYLTVAGIVNVILNLFFVCVLNMSITGVATASIISQYLSAFLILNTLFHEKEDYRLIFKDLKIDSGIAKTFISLGLPAGLQNSIFQFANLFIQAGVNSFSPVVVEGNSAAANADALVYDAMAAFYSACTSFMSQNYGAGQRQRTIKTYYICLVYSFLTGLFMGILLVLFSHQFLSVFTKDPEVIKEGVYRLTIMGFSYCVSAFMDCTIAASRSLGKSVIPMFIVIMGSCVFRVIWMYTVFAHFGTISSIYVLYVFSWTITAIAEIIYFAKAWKDSKAQFSF
ncbi:MAG: MATE family efflux transporter [Butyrivibrio sp.]|nr:MATE family efflux transporter [Butyrivibrio sp.]